MDNTTGRAKPLRAARVLTEVLAPTVLVSIYLLAQPFLVEGTTWLQAGVAVAFTTAIPFLAILWFKRAGGVTDHHISRRSQRFRPFLVAGVSLLVGVRVLRYLDAPEGLFLNLAAVFAGLVVCMVANLFWKLSVHSAVTAFVTLQLLSPLPYLGPAAIVALCAAVGWSRVRMGHHTPAQVAAGFAIGAALHVWRVLFLA